MLLLLLTDLRSAYDWCNSWLVTLKSEKSKVVHLSRSKDPYHHEYWLSDKPLSAVDHHKHLGVWLKLSLSWDYHINYICAKVNNVLSLIRRTFGPNNSEAVSTAYKTLVCPILEYGCQVWNPYLVKHIKKYRVNTEASHSSYLRIGERISGRLGVLKWPSLDIDPHMFFYFNVLAKMHRNHNFKIRPKKTRTHYFKFSFFNRYITDWKSTPSIIMHAPSLSSFNSYLLDHLCQF